MLSVMTMMQLVVNMMMPMMVSPTENRLMSSRKSSVSLRSHPELPRSRLEMTTLNNDEVFIQYIGRFFSHKDIFRTLTRPNRRSRQG